MTGDGYLSKSAEQSSDPVCGLKTVTLPFDFTFNIQQLILPQKKLK